MALRIAASRRHPGSFAGRHVLLELETVTNGRPWYDWEQWLDAVNIRGATAAGSLRFSHYDHIVQAAIEGAGWPWANGRTWRGIYAKRSWSRRWAMNA